MPQMHPLRGAALLDECGQVVGYEKALGGGRAPTRGEKSASRPVVQVALSGEIGAVDGLAGVVAFVHQSRWTGALHCVHDPRRQVIEFVDGEVSTAQSNHPRDRLGALLCDYGVVSPEALDRALAERAPGDPIGEALVARGVIAEDEALLFLERQVEEIFAEILELREGSYWFERSRDEDTKAFRRPRFSTSQLLVDTIRRLAALQAFRREIPSSSSILVRRRTRAAVTTLEADLGRVLVLVDGRRTVKDIARQARLGDLEATQRLHRLLELGLVELRGLQGAQDTLIDDFGALFAS